MTEVAAESRRKKSIFGPVVGISDKVDKDKCKCKKSKQVKHIVVYLPANYPSCPPGLEKLIPVDHLFVRQGIRETEPPFTMISKNKFEVLDGNGRRIFMARDSNQNILKLCCRGGCGQPFRMSIKEKLSGYEILAVNSRPDCYGAMSASISQNGMNLGFLSEDIRCCSSNYIVIDAQGTEIFRIYDANAGSPYSKGSYHRQEMERQANARREQEEQQKDEELQRKLSRRRHRHRIRLELQQKRVEQDEKCVSNHEILRDDQETTLTTQDVEPPTPCSSKSMAMAMSTSISRTGQGSGEDVVKIDVDVNENARVQDETEFDPPPQNHEDECPLSILAKNDGDDAQNCANVTPPTEAKVDEIRARKKRSVAFADTRNDNQLQQYDNHDYLQNIPFDAMSIEELDGDRDDPGCICGILSKRVRNLNSSCCGNRGPCPAKCQNGCGLGSCVGRCLDSCVSVISGGVEFAVYSTQLGIVVGRMGKQWEELYDQYFNLQECFGASFPRNLSVRHKSLLLGALFLLDFNHFQL